LKKVIILTIGGLLIFLFGFLAGGYWTALKFAGVVGHGQDTWGESSHEMISEKDSFWESLFWGAKWENMNKLKPVPEGKGYLTGNFTYNGKPVKGIKFKLFLNSKYKTAPMVTNDNGAFEVRVPEGVWYINMIQCEGWSNKPDGNFILLSGDEPRMDNKSPQDLFYHFEEKGKEVSVTNKKPPKELIAFTIKPRLTMRWPKDLRENQQASIAAFSIQWEPYPLATTYLLEIYRVTREGRTTTFSPIMYRRISGKNSLPLKDLPNTKGSEIEEYGVIIKAYDQAGVFISESPRLSATFSLSGGRRLSPDLPSGNCD
jgi:hypothetical protein